MTGLRQIREIIEETLRKFNLCEESRKLFAIWQEELGDLAKHAQIGSYSGGRLVIEVDNPVYMQELSARRKAMIERVNRRMGKKSVVEVRFRLGRIDRGKGED